MVARTTARVTVVDVGRLFQDTVAGLGVSKLDIASIQLARSSRRRL